MTAVPIVLAGWGPVGQAYAGLVREGGARWRERYGVDLRVVAIRGRHRQTGGVAWEPIEDLPALLARTGARVFAQAVPSDGAERTADEAICALAQGAHVVTATKSHLLTHWRDLESAALRSGRSVRISGATGAALPAGDLARSALRGFDVRAVAGCLNGTATFVLDRISAGDDLAAAVAHAQRLGIAEADPSADLAGVDAATKLRLLCGLLWGWDAGAVDVQAEPIRTPLPAIPDGHRLRQVAHARADEPGLVRVELRAEPVGSPLGALTGPEKAARFDCGEAGEVTVAGGRSSPHGAAVAMLKDTIGAVLEQLPGFG